MTPLHFSVEGNHRDAVKLLIEAGASVEADASGLTPLYFAVISNRKEIVMDLIKHGADPNVGYLLHYSIMHNFTDISHILINTEKCNINIQEKKTNTTPLLLAALRGQETVVGALLIKGADINSTDNLNMSALHCAATQGHDDAVKVLLKYNAKLNVRADDGSTPLHLAAILGHEKVLQLYLLLELILILLISRIEQAWKWLLLTINIML
ncbi:hypothetical protein JTE90_024103 [Oedothorax gibbosus]|uniref:Ankyrin repeat protein n=1 Tax=Oedothorax gibbosus TaxID=931172 RepID=A0AAV6USS0_9ARAC|nr:hypothetical protein JTE90_024103 [Oedothorax gibbosus]